MKKLVLLFGLLDLIALIKSFEQMLAIVKSEYWSTWMNIGWLMIYFSLIVSAYFLLKSSKTGLWVYYIQFPFRVIWTSGLSFGFILLIGRFFPDNRIAKTELMILCTALEIVRLILTIIIHKRHFSNVQSKDQ
jgi:hypothetical protein